MGDSTRRNALFRSELNKLLHSFCGLPYLEYIREINKCMKPATVHLPLNRLPRKVKKRIISGLAWGNPMFKQGVSPNGQYRAWLSITRSNMQSFKAFAEEQKQIKAIQQRAYEVAIENDRRRKNGERQLSLQELFEMMDN